MSIRGACVDRARVVEEVGVGPRVEGQTISEPTFGRWFRARLDIGPSEAAFAGGVEEATSMRGGRSTASARRSTQLMWPATDDQGLPIALHFTEKVQVVSKEQAENTVWQLTGEPQPIRKKRRVIGFHVSLTRVKEWEMPDVTRTAQGLP